MIYKTALALTVALGLAAAQNGADLCDPSSSVRLESMPARRVRNVASGPRVGIAVAQEHPWRFWIADAPSVSAFRPGGRRRASGSGQTDARE